MPYEKPSVEALTRAELYALPSFVRDWHKHVKAFGDAVEFFEAAGLEPVMFQEACDEVENVRLEYPHLRGPK